MFLYKNLSEWLQHLCDELGDLVIHIYTYTHVYMYISFMYINMDVPVYMNMCIHIIFLHKKLSEWLQHLCDELGDLVRYVCTCTYMYMYFIYVYEHGHMYLYILICMYIMFLYKNLSEWLQHLCDELGDLVIHIYTYTYVYMYIS
jgi:NTP pyrophosphatase (non-canonical NTP hydrolase)